MVSAPDQQAHRVHAQVRLPRFVLVRCPISGAIWLVVEPYPSEKYESQSVGKDDIPYISHGQYSQKMVDGHPIHNKDPKIMVIINPYEMENNPFMFEPPSGSRSSSSFRAHRRKDCRNHILQGL